MTEQLSDTERLIREAHEACPCRLNTYGICEIGCRDCPDPPHAQVPPCDCTWPGHAAIDAALRAVYLKGEDDGWHRCHRGGTGFRDADLPAWLPAGKEKAK